MEYFESIRETNKTASILIIDSITSKIPKKSPIQTLKGYLNTWIADKPRSKQQLMSQDQLLADTISKKNSIYGVLPFIAPEVLRCKPYTMASDIYTVAFL